MVSSKPVPSRDAPLSQGDGGIAGDNQHYVWQHYVRAWCNNKGLVHFKRKGQDPLVTNPRNIMAEKGFYKLQELDRFDLELLENFIKYTGSPDLKQHHRQLVEMFAIIVKGNELIQNQSLVLQPHIVERSLLRR